jgi:hypothetical protein
MIKEILQTQNSLADLSNFGKSHLSIQLSLDGFSYCVFDKDLVDVVLLKKYDFTNRAQNPGQLLKNIKEIYAIESILLEKFGSVSVSHQNNLSVLVPETMYDEKYLNDYLKYSIKTLDTDAISVDNIIGYPVKNIFVPFQNVNDYFTSIYSNFDSIHTSTVLLNSLLKYFKNTTQKYFFLNVSKHHLDIIYLYNGHIQFYNSFLYYSKEDFIYYTLFAMEQLDLYPDSQPVTFIGEVEKETPLYAMAFQYIRYINFLNINNFSLSEEFYSSNPHIQKHNLFELLNQF